MPFAEVLEAFGRWTPMLEKAWTERQQRPAPRVTPKPKPQAPVNLRRHQPTGKRIHELLEQEPRWWIAREVAETLGLRVNCVATSLSTLARANRVEAEKAMEGGRRRPQRYRKIGAHVGC